MYIARPDMDIVPTLHDTVVVSQLYMNLALRDFREDNVYDLYIRLSISCFEDVFLDESH